MKKYVLILAFLIFPQAPLPQGVRFMVLGDTHHISPAINFEGTFLYELSLAAIGEQVNFVFIAGDLEIQSFNGPDERDSVMKDWRWVLDTLSQHNIKVYACRGNTDVQSSEAWEVLFSDDYSFPQNGPENEKSRTYAVEYENMLFIALDQFIHSNSPEINQAWLDELLATNKKEHIFAAGHESAFMVRKRTMGYLYPDNRDIFWESLTRAGVKAYFCGHDHFYDHAIISDGDGNTENDIHQVVCGTGKPKLDHGGEYDGNNGRWTPKRIFHEEANGYVLVEINGSRVQITWKRRNGPNDFQGGGDTFLLPWDGSSTKKIRQPVPAIKGFPSPTRKFLTIQLPHGLPAYATVELLDICGKVITVNSIMPGNAGHTLNLPPYKSGSYFLRIGNAEYPVTERVTLY